MWYWSPVFIVAWLPVDFRLAWHTFSGTYAACSPGQCYCSDYWMLNGLLGQLKLLFLRHTVRIATINQTDVWRCLNRGRCACCWSCCTTSRSSCASTTSSCATWCRPRASRCATSSCRPSPATCAFPTPSPPTSRCSCPVCCDVLAPLYSCSHHNLCTRSHGKKSVSTCCATTCALASVQDIQHMRCCVWQSSEGPAECKSVLALSEVSKLRKGSLHRFPAW